MANTTTAWGASGEADGGGISNDATGTITLNNERVTANSAVGAGGGLGGGLGGGILSFAGTQTLVNSSVKGNHPDNCVGFTAPGCAP